MKTKFALIFSMVLILTTSAMAASRYWVGSGSWNLTSNWSTSSGGMGGATLPGSGDDVFFDRNTGNCTLANNVTVRSIQITSAGTFTGTINAGIYTINVTFNPGSGSGLNNIFAKGTISGTGGLVFNNDNSTIYFSGTTFSIPVSGTSAYILFNGSTFNETVTLTKTYNIATGFGSDSGTGGNTFQKALSLTHNSTSVCSLILGSTPGKPDTFNGPVTLTASNSGSILLALASTGNQFNDNISFNNTGTGTLAIGSQNICGSTLATGKTLSAGTFSSGSLKILSLTQAGTTAQTLTLTGTSTLLQIGDTNGSTVLGACTFNGDVTFTAPYFKVSASTFNGISYFTQTTSDITTVSSGGGNTYNKDVTFNNNSNATLSLANIAGDTYAKTVTYLNRNPILPMGGGATITNTYQGDIKHAGNSFAVNYQGKALFSGNAVQTIGVSGAIVYGYNFTNIEVNKSGGSIALVNNIQVSSDVKFVSGNITTTGTAYINFGAGATATGASNASYVDGIVRKTGNNAFTFPVGNGGVYRSIGMSAPASSTDAFTAQYYRTPQAYGSNKASTLAALSNCEYWTLDRSNGTSNVSVTLSWNSADCNGNINAYITKVADLRVSRWNGTQWADHGNGSTSGLAASGTVTSSAPITSFSPFVLASSTTSNPLPIVLSDFQASLYGSSVKCTWETASEINNDYFTLERSENGKDFFEIAKVKGAGNKSAASFYSYWDERAAVGISYYRLKQTDFDGTVTYLGVRTVDNKAENSVLNIYPNPVEASGTLHTNFTGAAKIISSTGQEIASIENASEFTLSELAAGIYILHTGDGHREKFIVK